MGKVHSYHAWMKKYWSQQELGFWLQLSLRLCILPVCDIFHWDGFWAKAWSISLNVLILLKLKINAHFYVLFFLLKTRSSQDRHNVLPKVPIYTNKNKHSSHHLCKGSLKELLPPTGLVNLISQTKKVIIRIFMLILFSHHKLTPGVTVIRNTLCDLAALQTLLTSLL